MVSYYYTRNNMERETPGGEGEGGEMQQPNNQHAKTGREASSERRWCVVERDREREQPRQDSGSFEMMMMTMADGGGRVVGLGDGEGEGGGGGGELFEGKRLVRDGVGGEGRKEMEQRCKRMEDGGEVKELVQRLKTLEDDDAVPVGTPQHQMPLDDALPVRRPQHQMPLDGALPVRPLPNTLRVQGGIKGKELRGFLATPLMSGVQYWRETPTVTPTAEQPPGGQYAIPLDSSSVSVNEPEYERPKASSVRPLKSICRRAKKIQVRMPSIRRGGSKRVNAPDETPVPEVFKAIAYEDVEEGPPPAIMTRRKYGDAMESPFSVAPKVEQLEGQESSLSLASKYRLPWELDPQLPGKPKVERLESVGMGQESSVSLRCKTPPCRPRRPDDLRPTLSAASTAVDTPGKKSFGSLLLSDAPTYVTAAPPPYRSRPVSIMTTSSFGCIDGMSSEQRQLHRHKARGVKGKLKRIARKGKAKFLK